MEGDKRRTREDTWKSDELKKHLTGSLSDNQSDDKRHRERKPHERDGWDAPDYKGSLYKEQGKGRVKSKERTGEKARFKSSERHREERKESGREKDHPREREREKFKATRDRHGKEEKQSAGRGGERQSGGERERKPRKDDPNHAPMQNTAVIYGERSKEHYRRRDSKDYRDPSKAREEEKERRYSERKNKEAKNHEGEISKYRDEEHEHQRRSHREEELDKDRKRNHKEKREWERSVVEGKEKLLKESLRAYKNGQEGHVPRSRKEPPFHEDRLYKESSERRQKEDGEMKKRDHKPSEHKSQRKSSRHEDETEHLRERSSKEKIKNQARSEKEDTRQEEPIKDITNPANSDADYDNYSVNYEEDFEDYEDDFDDTDDDEDDVEGQGTGEREEEEREAEEKVRKVPVFKNSEIEEIQKAINAENERAQTFLPGQKKNEFLPKEDRQDSPRRSPVPGKFIDFQTAKRQQSIRKVASEQKKRSLELLRLIDLDFSVSFCLLDLPPVNEYDMYIRNFGKTNTKQAYVQWNEDNLERDVQTEEIEMQEKWTQHPGETAIVCGGPKKSSSDVSVLAPKIDSQRLASFLRSACQVIAVLLEEDQVATQPRRNLRSRQTSLSISDKCFQLNTNLPFLQGRKVSCLHISQAQRQALLSVHTFPEKPSDLPLDRKNIICVWNVWQPSNPQKILFCGSQVTCCCFSPSKATLVFAGTGDGSVLVWDLREDSRMHHCMNFNETDWAFRSPTFSTDGVFTSLSHMCPILTIEPVSTTVFKEQNCGLSYLSSREELLGLSFQIASMDENGILSLWVVVELQKEDLAGSQRDLGLIPGGKVKLVHSSTFQIKCSYLPKDTMCLGTCQPLNIKFLPSNPNHFIVGTDMAVVTHGTRHELKAPPKLFKPQQGGPRSARVNAMDFSPFGKPLFLAGCSDGSIRLHQMTSELPLIQWNASTAGQPIIALQWALTRPAVFFALDATSVVYVWDLLETDLSPVAKQPTQADKVLTMAVLGEPEKLNGLLGLALAKESGIIEIWYVKKKWAVPQPEESEKLNLLLQQAL
ncbi:cytoplasmic dynein 2 intermediate chain 1 isoform X2 [Sphaerodactylus townsendi]|uniref:cytoplasmic dynein 2 intermediate chain 1 isoform X2 n=1 Tax=Sphaerodactylus townsendi TaxID=933632 RepID=UPI002025FD6D|nr:cytoplasmic dynein 2 intermediate chain 1 isoform X2 [Sphaerodactylus townsendi]